MSSDAAVSESDIRPLVAPPRSNRSVWIFGALLGGGALLLFMALETRRAGLDAESAFPAQGGSGGATIAAPAPLTVPAGDPYAPVPAFLPPATVPAPALAPVISPSTASSSPIQEHRPPAHVSPPPFPERQVYPVDGGAAPGRTGAATGPVPGPSAAASNPADRSRVSASFLEHPSLTVPQGTVIQAVLETAVDSTRSGFARAIVSRDVRGFDGSRVLIPRGSRLLGDYKADLSQGQNRVSIQWKRLIRPDGAVIDIDSPAADPLGRAGVKGKVNSHFFERFGGNILQSALDIGVGLATRSVTDGTVILAVPGAAGGQGVVPQIQPDQIRPTVTIRQGTSVSVFVARDLDFSAVED